jgi:hypothetical protein
MSSISDIVNAKIIELLLECCRKTVIECSQHYGFSSEEALGKMGLLTDFSNLLNLQPCVSDENVSLSDVSVKTPLLEENKKVKKVSKPRVKKVEVSVSNENPEGISIEAKPKKVSKPRVKKVTEGEGVVPVPVTEGVIPEGEVKVDTEKPKKVSKPRVKKEKVTECLVTESIVTEKVVTEGVVSSVSVSVIPEGEVKVDVEKPKKVSKPRVKKEKKEGEEDSVSSSPKVKGDKGRPKKDKKETELASPIDDLFANLVAKEEEVPQVDVVNKIDFQGTTYLKSKNTGIIYNMDQDVVGKWNENTKTIDFDEEEEEEEEEEYDEE